MYLRDNLSNRSENITSGKNGGYSLKIAFIQWQYGRLIKRSLCDKFQA